MTDEEIMQKVSQDQLDQLSLLFKRYHLKIFNYFVRMTRDESLSEDLTQNVFERIIRYRRSFRGDKSFKSWVYQIARNIHKDHFRLNPIRIDDSIGVQDLGLSTSNEDAIPEERRQQLERAIARLKPEYREVIVLGWIQNMKYAEVAEVLGISESNVKVRIHRAIKQLQKLIQKSTCL